VVQEMKNQKLLLSWWFKKSTESKFLHSSFLVAKTTGGQSSFLSFQDRKDRFSSTSKMMKSISNAFCCEGKIFAFLQKPCQKQHQSKTAHLKPISP
jgi:hypothetical protein